jgi:hypothetical protein
VFASKHEANSTTSRSGDYVGLGKVVTFEEKGFVGDFGESVGETVPEVEPCRMTAFAKP